MIKHAIETNIVTYKGTGAETREYIHASDGAASAVEILGQDFENQIIHLTGHERITTKNMMEMIAEIIGKDVKVKLGHGEMKGHYFQTPYSYTPKLGRKLIRNSYIDLGLGLLNLIEHYVQEESNK